MNFHALPRLLPALLATVLGLGLHAQAPTALSIQDVSHFYDQPYLLDFNFALRDQNDKALILDPSQITVVCREDGTPISASETGFRLLAAANKQLKCFLVLDYTLSMADPAANGDSDGDGLSDALETMEAAAKTLIGTLNPDAQVGLYEFHREDAAHPPQKVSDLTVDKAALTNHIDRIWTDYVQWFPAATRVWDAVYAAIQEYPTSRVVDEQRVVVFLSDGRDESSTRRPNDVISAAQDRGVKVYPIGFGDELTPAPLQNIAGSTGGRYYPALTIPQLAERFQQLTDDLRGNYVLRWATLKRTGSFTPSFSLTYQGLTATHSGQRYYPGSYAGDVLQGRLVFDAALDEGEATVGLRAYYIPRFITRLRFQYASDKPLTVQRVPLAEGGIVPDTWLFEHNATEHWIELRSPNPQNIFTALPYATQGRLLRFVLTGVADLTTCFSNFSVDNTLYTAGGQTFVILNTALVGRLGQTITFAPLADRLLSMSPFTVSATASSGLPVTFRIVSGPATLSGTSVTLTGTGRVTIRAEQAGNDTYSAAAVEQSFEVIDRLPHGTPLDWLARYGLTSDLIQAELLDPDGDGSPMWHEYRAGTNPTNAASVLALSLPDWQAGGWQIAFPSQNYRKYRIDTSEDLSTWTPWQTEVPGDGQLLSYVDPITGPQRFYRVVQTQINEPPPGMVWIPPGTFLMGSPASEPARWSDEGPQTVVTLSRGFWLGKYEVTQREYLAVMGNNPSYFTGDLDRPVEQVSWHDAVAYCEKLTQQERAAGRLPEGYEYRLPTEAQWEYACRAGTTTATAFGNSLSSTQANFDGNYPYNGGAVGPYLGRTTKVGSYLPNAWGLYDMHGNVWEWCADWYSDSYPGGAVTDPRGPISGSIRVNRGGGWYYFGRDCRSAVRDRGHPSVTSHRLGFRAALVPVP
ncbi:MAG: SUMF1/EgtB/PvdO family nonheme iron enzyme [Verrucomicrobia bacterium]|nr:SUMF1/EgtB/PvdO family nonheme iron enzyme [Verrucomicrobiota bacterium]